MSTRIGFNPWLVCGVVLATFFAGSSSAPVVVTPLPRFEYLCVPKVQRPWEQADLERMNELGARGWDLVTQLAPPNHDVWCFKRQLR